ncbi:MAG: VWA domain-containing protein, partial [Flavobacteriaceae bacterium]|nr:VWA domain-containing protein [Flavobacteriaceae bacterium]
MKKLYIFDILRNHQSLRTLMLMALVMCSSFLSAQGIELTKSISSSTLNCLEYDVSLTVQGESATGTDVPVEVILVIDRSGSMGYNIPGDSNESIDYAKDAAIELVNYVFEPANNILGLNKVGIVSYGNSGRVDYALSPVSEQQDIIDEINSLVASGYTNIADAMNMAREHLSNYGNFDCAASRNIILLSDGVPTRSLNSGRCSISAPAPPYPQNSNVCMEQAIEQGLAAQLITQNGENFTQSIFSIGLFGAIDGDDEAAANYVLNNIQNSGLFTTESAVDLSDIYEDIYGEFLFWAARNGVVTDVLDGSFELVPGSITNGNASYDSASNTMTWQAGNLTSTPLTLNYSIRPTSGSVCGDQNTGATLLTYTDSACSTQTASFDPVQVCVPCPELSNPDLNQENCAWAVNYAATFDAVGCSAEAVSFDWDFYLNNVLVGSISDTDLSGLEGSFIYTGSASFSGDFKAVLSYNGTYSNSCAFPEVVTESTITVVPTLYPNAPELIADINECVSDPIQILDANDAIVIESGTTISWYDASSGGNAVVDPTLNALGSVTYYAQADAALGCSSLSRTAVVLTLVDAPVAGITNVTGATELTCDVTEIILEATGGGSYLWSTGAS